MADNKRRGEDDGDDRLDDEVVDDVADDDASDADEPVSRGGTATRSAGPGGVGGQPADHAVGNRSGGRVRPHRAVLPRGRSRTA